MAVLVGKPAPDFTVPAVLANGEIVDEFNLSKALKGKYGLVFFYPLDFTFVCDLVEALGRHSHFSKSKPLSILSGEIDESGEWLEVFAVRLAGELKLHEAIPLIVSLLHEADD